VLKTLHKLVHVLLEMKDMLWLLPEHGRVNTARLQQEQMTREPPECHWIDTLDWAAEEDRFPAAAGVVEDGSVD
jgi:hypothetical protein